MKNPMMNDLFKIALWLAALFAVWITLVLIYSCSSVTKDTNVSSYYASYDYHYVSKEDANLICFYEDGIPHWADWTQHDNGVWYRGETLCLCYVPPKDCYNEVTQ